MIPEAAKVTFPWAVLATSFLSMDSMYKVLQMLLMVAGIAISVQTLLRRHRRAEKEARLQALVDKAQLRCTKAMLGDCPLREDLDNLKKEDK